MPNHGPIRFEGSTPVLRVGVPVRMPPTNYPWALEMHLEDPDGNVLRLGSEPI